MQKNPHSEIVNQILVEASCRHDCRVWKSPVGMADLNGRQIRYGVAGMPDIMGIMRIKGIGQAIGIEVKTGTGKLSDIQVKFHEMFLSYGGKIMVARNVESALAWLDGLSRGVV